MNKQQLAAKIWASANQMRSKIEAHEYKDYILGFIFYKYLSDTLEQFAQENDFSAEDIQALDESDADTVKYFQTSLGYFIAYENLFSTWLKQGSDFSVANVRDALSAFSRLIGNKHKILFDDIFDTLQTGLSKLGTTTGEQSKAISSLLQLIKDIPTDGRQGYDVLGFIYEYLIEKFAANAGKKAGEFYTPHEVSVLIAEIVAAHLKDRKRIDIYDPTSGSGSLLLNIGEAVAKHMDARDAIKYYAQELKKNTYNLTRMNLVMRGIKPDNIVTRNADTLEDDWPYFDESDPVNSYEPLYLDAVVSNPPYSQKWDPTDKDNDPRYARFGLAPKSKADFAFLLHDLYHLKPDGIMAIILPHGVLFRGGQEGEIRKNLIENNHIDTVIGLPSSIFYGTGIPTIIMVLKQKRDRNDVLIIDASKGFVKVGKNNELRACDIKKIADTVHERRDEQAYSRVVSKQEIQDNEYNLNIPRYVDSSEPAETWDLYASMFGGVPNHELDAFEEYWRAYPGLRAALFDDRGTPYSTPLVDDFHAVISAHASVQQWLQEYRNVFSDFPAWLTTAVIDQALTLHLHRQQTALAEEIFTRLGETQLVDKYQAYQLLAEQWAVIANDIEILQSEGLEAVRVVDPLMVQKKVKNADTEVQEGWQGRILPFDLVQTHCLAEQKKSLDDKRAQLADIPAALEEIIESLDEDEGEYSVLNDANDKFVVTALNAELKEQLEDIETDELNLLHRYVALLDAKAKKPEKIAFVQKHPKVAWDKIDPNKDGTYGKGGVNRYITTLQQSFEFPEDSFASKLQRASALLAQEKSLKEDIKIEEEQIHLATKAEIESLTDAQVQELLNAKWIKPLIEQLLALADQPIRTLALKLQALVDKYSTTFADNARAIAETDKELVSMIDELTGNTYDLQGLSAFQNLLQAKGES